MNYDQAMDAGNDPRPYYEANGYVVVRQLIPDRLIDPVLAGYLRDIKPSRSKFFRQSSSVYSHNAFNEGGHVTQSFLDIHNYKRFPGFRSAALDLYFSIEMLGALRAIAGHDSHNLMQSMLFDANVVSPPHQDHWYVDTVPAGNVLGAWIAMEDIQEEAGRFYVMPGTQRERFVTPGMSHSDWLGVVKRFRDSRPELVFAPALKKGDVLFWNSGTVHGALPNQDPRVSRKSLTAHYMPTGLTFGNLFGPKPWVKYERHGAHQYFANQPEYSLKADLVSRLKWAIYDRPALLKFARRFQRRSLADV